MRSEDIADYVAGLEEALDRAERSRARETDTAYAWERRAETAEAEVERLRAERDDARAEAVNWQQATENLTRTAAALPVLPEVGPVTRHANGSLMLGTAFWAGEEGTAEGQRYDAAEHLAVAAFLDAEAADTTPDKRPCGSEGPGEPCDCDLDSSPLTDTTPDTSRVTFGSRHEGTGMVLLQHADLPATDWGDEEEETVQWLRAVSHGAGNSKARSAYAALAEVREALNTAEADGVKILWGGVATSDGYFGESDLGSELSIVRARRFLAREVQALVDQGLRGDDLNARLPYEVRDHRVPGTYVIVGSGGSYHLAPVEAADTSSDGDEAGPVPAGTPLLTPKGVTFYAGSSLGQRRQQEAVTFEPRLEHIGWYPFGAVNAWAAAHRAARTSEDKS